MANDASNSFDASASLIGYLYQLRMALALLLQRVGVDPGISISIEIFDDIAFHASGNVIEQIQTKHVSTKTLTDSSPDLWKTVRVWATQFKAGTLDPASTNLVLLTTAEAPAGSAASYLRLKGRDQKKAQEILEEIAKKSVSATNEKAYEAFRALSKPKRAQLLRSIYVHDKSLGMLKASNLIEQELRIAARRPDVPVMASRLEGWWFQKCIEHLGGMQKRISGDELETKISELREQFKLNNLPIDYATAEIPPGVELTNYLFLHQLSLISLASKRVVNAMLDYYRAVQQRSRWIGDHLVSDDELIAYERRLRETWSEIFESKIQADTQGQPEVTGREIYDAVMLGRYLALRPACTEGFVMRGSFHMLANAPTIGWHPQYESLLDQKNANTK
jgi:hypothetical protein